MNKANPRQFKDIQKLLAEFLQVKAPQEDTDTSTDSATIEIVEQFFDFMELMRREFGLELR